MWRLSNITGMSFRTVAVCQSQVLSLSLEVSGCMPDQTSQDNSNVSVSVIIFRLGQWMYARPRQYVNSGCMPVPYL